MEKFSVLVDADAQQMKQAHENPNPNSIPEKFVRKLLEDAVDSADPSNAHYLDDVEIISRDRVHEGSDKHYAKKEIASGDAHLRVAISSTGAETYENVDVQYGFYAGRKNGELRYDSVQVEVIPK